MLVLLNFLVFQAGWFTSVLGAANQMPWLGPLLVLVAVALHLRLARRPSSELMLIVACGGLGAVFDSALVAAGWVRYPSGMLAAGVAPYWIVGMWLLFATTLNVSLRWLRGRTALAAVLGFVAGPASYVAGAKLGGITLVDPTAALVTLAIGWGAMLPALFVLARRFDGFRPEQAVLPGKAS